MKIRIFGVVSALGLAVFWAASAPVSADPKRGGQLVANCEGIGEVTVNFSPGRGSSTPGFDDAGTRVFVPYAIHVVATTTDANGSHVDEYGISKNMPRSGRTTVCTIVHEYTDEHGSHVDEYTVGVHYTPGH